jgi:beta-glucosidase
MPGLERGIARGRGRIVREGACLGACILAALLPCRAVGGDAPGVPHPDLWPRPAHGLPMRPEVEAFVDELLAHMTVEEKVGQLIQADIGSITPDDLRTYKLGSVQASGNSAPDNDVRAAPRAWLQLSETLHQASIEDGAGPHPPIPLLFAIDAVHGHARVKGATIFPHNIALGAAHDPALIRRIGQATAEEIVATGMDWTFAPTVAVVRDARWGRTYESYSEEPGLVGICAAAMTAGLQGDVDSPDFLGPRHTLATLKHFLGDGGTIGVDQGNDAAPESELVRVHAAGYVRGIDAGAATVMASYSSWQGIKMHANGGLLTGVLKDRLGFSGIIVGDWNAQEQIPGCSKFDCPAAILAGIDVLMGPDGWRTLYSNTLAEARAGIIPPQRLDDAVRRILRIKALAGLFAGVSPRDRSGVGRLDRVGSAEHRAIAREAVRKSLVLLKNDHGLLPLDPRARVLVAGDGADDLGKQAGGWTVDWQGDRNTAADFPGATSIYAGIQAAVEGAGGTAVLRADGHFAGRLDAAIVVFGENPYAEFQGDLENLSFGQEDRRPLALLKRLRSRRIPVISIFLSGRPRWTNPEINASDAFVAAWLPGTEGEGIADVLFRAPGSVSHEFTGKLSVSWPATAMPVRFDADDRPIGALFSRGYGLRYGDLTAVPRLPEDPKIPADLIGGDTLFRAGRVTRPWSLFVADSVAAVRLTLPRQQSPGGAVSLTVNQDGATATWTGAGSGTLFINGRTADLRKRAAGGSLSMRYRVDAKPTRAVKLQILCGKDCAPEIDITRRIDRAPLGAWREIRVPLSCFGIQHLATVDAPFVLKTDGEFAMTLSSVRFEPKADRAGCGS